MRKTFLKSCLVGLLSIPISCVMSHAASFVTDFNSGLPAGSSVFAFPGSAPAVVRGDLGVGNSGVLQLNNNGGGQGGAYYVNDFLGGTPVTNFHLSCRLAIGGAPTRPADGMSFALGSDLAAVPNYTA